MKKYFLIFFMFMTIYGNDALASCVTYSACSLDGPCTTVRSCHVPASISPINGSGCSGYSCSGSYQPPPSYLEQQRRMCRNEVNIQLGNSCKTKSDNIFNEDISACNNIGYGSAGSASTSVLLLSSIVHPATMAGRAVLFVLGALTGGGGAVGLFHASGPCKEAAAFARSENYKYCDNEVSRFQKEICNF